MVPDAYHDFFLASVGASAALIGLLFVAISIAPEGIFGPEANGERQGLAVSAFIVLGNVFFLSLAGLMPDLNLGLIAVVTGASGLTNIIMLTADVRPRKMRQPARAFVLLAGSLAIYLLEIWWGSALLRDSARRSAVENLTYLVLVAYAVGLTRAWELMGGTDYSLIRSGLALIRRRRGRDDGTSPIDRAP
jgi:hypothetical protein